MRLEFYGLQPSKEGVVIFLRRVGMLSGQLRDHDGWSAASSAVEKGSRFSIYLPLTLTCQKDAENDQERPDRG